MIIDWSDMDPWIPGEAEDAIGRPLPRLTRRVDTLTGEVTIERRDSTGRLVIVDDAIQLETFYMVPPITVWLYT